MMCRFSVRSQDKMIRKYICEEQIGVKGTNMFGEREELFH